MAFPISPLSAMESGTLLASGIDKCSVTALFKRDRTVTERAAVFVWYVRLSSGTVEQ